ncbi:MAG TPA: hypothetical protein VM011_00135 [Gammaproteobacteria bacterium]|nr:hypothetical protein [Gammaproteobacteria bacterium]
MRKHITGEVAQKTSPAGNENWLDLDQLVTVELTSEDAAYPIESALLADGGPGWRAQDPGKQTIRLLFDKPRRISHIQLVFQEEARGRTQEFVLRWAAGGGAPDREIVRQQYNFSPPDATRELEDYIVELDGLTVLELMIIPDISGNDTRASLAQLRLA